MIVMEPEMETRIQENEAFSLILPNDLIHAIFSYFSWMQLFPLKRISKQHHQKINFFFNTIKSEDVVQIISDITSAHAMQFVRYYHQTKSYQDLQKKHETQPSIMTPMEIVCYALTKKSSSIHIEALRKAIPKIKEKLDIDILKNLYSQLLVAEYAKKMDSQEKIDEPFQESDTLSIFEEYTSYLLLPSDEYRMAEDSTPLELLVKRTNTKYINLVESNLCDAYLEEANLAGADLSGANLNNATLCYANLSNANLINANLTNVNLDHAILTGAIFFPEALFKSKDCSHLKKTLLYFLNDLSNQMTNLINHPNVVNAIAEDILRIMHDKNPQSTFSMLNDLIISCMNQKSISKKKDKDTALMTSSIFSHHFSKHSPPSSPIPLAILNILEIGIEKMTDEMREKNVISNYHHQA